jgi:diaminopimelate epimerase
MIFDKMQALGNDFVMIDLNQFAARPPFEKAFFRSICHRNLGVGCDSAVLHQRRENGSLQAEFFNPDGSEAEICGNAARCLGLLMKKRFGTVEFPLEAGGKIYPIRADDEISVGMGRPSFDPDALGLSEPVPDPLSMLRYLPCDPDVREAACVSVGNPHLILFLGEAPDENKVSTLGKLSEHPLFANRINVSLAFVKSENEIILSVFERGVGPTLACGSGACAAVAVARAGGFMKSENIRVHQRGGSLTVTIGDDGGIFQTGPAAFVFSGETGL